MKINPETGEKICSKCKEVKTADDFTVNRRKSDGLDGACRDCNKKKSICYRESNRDNPEYSERRHKFNLQWSKNNPEAKLWYNCVARAKAKELPCTITKDDINIPECCPICEHPMISGSGMGWEDHHTRKLQSPSVDMYDPRLGYIKSNVWIICLRCNSRKQDMSGEDHIAFGHQLITAREKALAVLS